VARAGAGQTVDQVYAKLSLSHTLSLMFSSLYSASSIVEGERVRKMRKGVSEREREWCARLEAQKIIAKLFSYLFR